MFYMFLTHFLSRYFVLYTILGAIGENGKEREIQIRERRIF